MQYASVVYSEDLRHRKNNTEPDGLCCRNGKWQSVIIKTKPDNNTTTTMHYMMTSSNGKIYRVTGPLCGEFTGPGEFPTQRPVTRSFDVFCDLRLNKLLSKQQWGWWFETPSCSLSRQCNDLMSHVLWGVSNHHGNSTVCRTLITKNSSKLCFTVYYWCIALTRSNDAEWFSISWHFDIFPCC